MTRKWRHLTGINLEEAVEGQKRAYTVHFTSYKAVACWRRQSRDRKWQQVTSGNRKWPRSDVIWPEVTGSGSSGPKTGIYCTFHFLQGCSSQNESGTWQKMMSRDLRWPEVTRKCCHLTGSHLEVTVEFRKLPYTVHFTSYKAVARRGWQTRGRKWHHVTSDDRKWPGSDVPWPEITWKWVEMAENSRILYISVPTRL